MTNLRQQLGRDGEDQAARFLETRGYRIVAQNVRADRVEIDLIVRRGTLLVFVEVKSRRTRLHSKDPAADRYCDEEHSYAAEAVDERKQRRLRRGALAWLATNPAEARRTRRRRFDVVTCLAHSSSSPSSRPSPIPPPPLSTLRSQSTKSAQNKTTAPDMARWSIKHWEAAF